MNVCLHSLYSIWKASVCVLHVISEREMKDFRELINTRGSTLLHKL